MIKYTVTVYYDNKTTEVFENVSDFREANGLYIIGDENDYNVLDRNILRIEKIHVKENEQMVE